MDHPPPFHPPYPLEVLSPFLHEEALGPFTTIEYNSGNVERRGSNFCSEFQSLISRKHTFLTLTLSHSHTHTLTLTLTHTLSLHLSIYLSTNLSVCLFSCLSILYPLLQYISSYTPPFLFYNVLSFCPFRRSSH